MDKDLVAWINKAAEAERNRQSAVNKAAALENKLNASRKALNEADAMLRKLIEADIFDRNEMIVSGDQKAIFHKREFTQLRNMVRHAAAGVQPVMEVGEVVTTKKARK